MKKLLNEAGFNIWAKDYDDAVIRNCHKYPFDKYYEGLYCIYNVIQPNDKILDIGFGTGTLTKRLYDNNCEIYGIDFSEEMIKISKNKMPNSKLFHYDFNNGLPEELDNMKFDYIISTYAIHHLTDPKKIEFINNLKFKLNKNGKIIILDIAFSSSDDLNNCKINNKEDWDPSEHYIVWNLLKESLPDFKYRQFSTCSGFIELI
jgi:putative AdoMet-dependent methyltransferase